MMRLVTLKSSKLKKELRVAEKENGGNGSDEING